MIHADEAEEGEGTEGGHRRNQRSQSEADGDLGLTCVSRKLTEEGLNMQASSQMDLSLNPDRGKFFLEAGVGKGTGGCLLTGDSGFFLLLAIRQLPRPESR